MFESRLGVQGQPGRQDDDRGVDVGVVSVPALSTSEGGLVDPVGPGNTSTDAATLRGVLGDDGRLRLPVDGH